MSASHLRRSFLAAFVLVFGCLAPAAEPVLQPNARLAIIGDSITEQKLYSKFMETYLLACAGRTDVRVMQFGWGGERATGFVNRLANDLGAFQPTAATTCYGMNDGSYQPFNEAIGSTYEKGTRDMIAGFSAVGVKTIVIGSPGAVDTKFFAKPGDWKGQTSAQGYNDNLKSLSNIDQKLATELKTYFADVHSPMIDAMAKAKAALGDTYDVCGKDGLHPGPNGHLVMAYAFLKALGCDGDIGAVTVDLASKTAEATAGHKAAFKDDGVEVESVRYPFCHTGDAKSSNGTRSITPFLPFDQELNRLTLKVKGLKTDKATVAWGTEKKDFSRADLEKGVNLADEFEKTPFDAQFQKFMQAVGDKQIYETAMIKGLVTNFRTIKEQFKNDAEVDAAVKVLLARLQKRQAELDDAARAQLVPVKHQIQITPIAK